MSEFDTWSVEDKAYAVLYRRSKNQMEAFDLYLAEQEAKRKAKRK